MRRNPILSALGQTVRQHPVMTLALVASIAAAVLSGIAPPLALEEAVNRLTSGAEVPLWLAIFYFALLAASGLCDALKERLILGFGQKVIHTLRSRMCEKLSRLEAEYYVNHEPGVTASRFVGDVDTVEALFTGGVISMAVDLCKVVSILIVIFARSVGLGILLLLAMPALFALTRVFQKRMLSAQKDNREAVGRANQQIPETVRCLRTVRNLGREDFMESRYDGCIRESYRAVERSNFCDAAYSPIIVTFSALLVGVVMVLSALGGQWTAFFGMSVGSAVAVIAYVGKVFDPLESIGMEIQNIQAAAAGISRIREFLNEKEIAASSPAELKKDCPAVRAEGLHFGYTEEISVLQNFDLTVMPGETVTVVGRTGAGKSTLFRLILGLYRPQSGKIEVFGADASKLTPEQRRNLFGYVEQRFRPVPGSVRDQITLGDPSLTDAQVQRALEITDMLHTVSALEQGLNTPYRAELFSQGQNELLGIARAVVRSPQILLLDEITANLDAATEAQVLSALDRAAENRTVISISHRLTARKGRTISL